MSRRNRHQRHLSAKQAVLPLAICETHQKGLYSARKQAKAAARNKIHKQHLNAFPCDRSPGLWHIGNLPRSVKAGDITRDQAVMLPRPTRAWGGR